MPEINPNPTHIFLKKKIFSGIFSAFAQGLKDNYSEQLSMTGFVIILLKWKTQQKI